MTCVPARVSELQFEQQMFSVEQAQCVCAQVRSLQCTVDALHACAFECDTGADCVFFAGRDGQYVLQCLCNTTVCQIVTEICQQTQTFTQRNQAKATSGHHADNRNCAKQISITLQWMSLLMAFKLSELWPDVCVALDNRNKSVSCASMTCSSVFVMRMCRLCCLVCNDNHVSTNVHNTVVKASTTCGFPDPVHQQLASPHTVCCHAVEQIPPSAPKSSQ